MRNYSHPPRQVTPFPNIFLHYTYYLYHILYILLIDSFPRWKHSSMRAGIFPFFFLFLFSDYSISQVPRTMSVSCGHSINICRWQTKVPRSLLPMHEASKWISVSQGELLECCFEPSNPITTVVIFRTVFVYYRQGTVSPIASFSKYCLVCYSGSLGLSGSSLLLKYLLLLKAMH